MLNIVRQGVESAQQTCFKPSASQCANSTSNNHSSTVDIVPRNQRSPKRRRTTQEFSSPPIRSSRRRTAQTYGSSARSHLGPTSTPPKWDQHTQLGAITFPTGQNVEDAMATSPIEQIQTHEQWNNPADVSSTEPMGSHTQKMLVDEALATRDLNTTSSKRPNGTDAPNLGTSDSSILWPALQSSSASWERQASQSMPIGTSEMQGLFAMGTQPKKRKNHSQTSTENI